MRLHGVKICCDRMQEYVLQKKIVANYDQTAAYADILYTPDPAAGQDHVLTINHERIYFCPGCGESVDVYGLTLPKPTPVYATQTGGICNVTECPYNDSANTACTLKQSILSFGCWMQSESVRAMIQELYSNLDLGVNDALTDA